MIPPFNKNCGSCRLYIPAQKTCQIAVPQLAGKFEPDDFCSKHINYLPQCEICGAGLLEPLIEVKDGKAHIYCANCIVREKS